MKFDDLFDTTGQIGTFQLCAFGILCWCGLFGADNIAQNFVAGSTMEHWCKVPRLLEFPYEQQKYVAIPIDSDGNYDSCSFYDLNYTSYSDEQIWNWNRSDISNAPVIDCDDSWVYDKTMYASTLRSTFNLVCSKAALLPLAASMYYFGLMFGAYLTGEFSDRFGRKMTLYLCFFGKFALGMAEAWSPTYWMYLTCKFGIGFVSGGCYTTAFLVVLELVGPRFRAPLGMLYHLSFSVGYIVYSAEAYAVRDWRILESIIYAPWAFLLISYFVIPETPRWLIRNGHLEKAKAVITRMCVVNRREVPENLADMLRDIVKGEEEVQEAAGGKKTCFSMYTYPNLRKWCLAINFHWFVDSMMYYALSLSTSSLAGNVFINTSIMGLVEFPAILLGILAMEWRVLGRRLTCAFSLAIAGVCSFIMVPLILNNNGTGTTVMSFVGKAFVSAAFDGVYIFTSEVYPTEVRNAGIGAASTCARVGGIMAPYMGTPLASIWSPLPSIVFGGLGTAAGLCLLVVPETLGKPMFQTVAEAENLSKKSSELMPKITDLCVTGTEEVDADLKLQNDKFTTHL